MKQKPLTIRRLAEAANVNVETVRYYQRIGLIEKPAKPSKGYRQYPEKTIEHMAFIKGAKKFGFSLQEIKDLLELGDNICSINCTEIQKRIETKSEHVTIKIKELEKLLQILKNIVVYCHSVLHSLQRPPFERSHPPRPPPGYTAILPKCNFVMLEKG